MYRMSVNKECYDVHVRINSARFSSIYSVHINYLSLVLLHDVVSRELWFRDAGKLVDDVLQEEQAGFPELVAL